ncbi:MAG: two-component regulator propeller domain-containing protein [Salibacter sp.]|uniref:type IX secretion system anionic LPS delivery protein PorZ n=1 Tax=Salibacter sp. TaxID=2010995 RepID=UPI0028707DCC|nr:two-component regulator propeller domain-containing protein [Salibacter sp.]MDR9398581.1 two-component regulator propeller domain-containing protein [Salibacter sp.]
MKYLGYLVLTVTILSNSVFGQSGSSVGTWIDYLPYESTFKVVAAKNKVYAATPFSLVEIDKRDNSARRLSALNGLSEVGVTALGYDQNTNTVIVGYNNGIFDLITENTIYSIQDIERANIAGDKRITNIQCDGQHAYLTTTFGIVQYNISRREVSETFRLNQEGDLAVFDVAFKGDTIFAATEEGLYKASLSDPNVGYYIAWEKPAYDPEPNTEYEFVEIFQNKLVLNIPSDKYAADSILIQSDSGWFSPQFLQESNFFDIIAYTDQLLLSRNGDVVIVDSGFQVQQTIFQYYTGQRAQPRAIVKDGENNHWIADNQQGVIKVKNLEGFDRFLLDGPPTNNANEFAFGNEQTYIASGATNRGLGNEYLREGVYFLSNSGDWSQYSYLDDDRLNNVFDYISLAVDPTDESHFFVGTIGSGILEFESEELIEIYDNDNSPLKNVSGLDDTVGTDVRINGLDFDEQGNLWISNSITQFGVAVRTAEGEFMSYNLSEYLDSEAASGDIIASQTGYKWMLLPNKGKGILVFDDNGTPLNTQDDRAKILNSAGGNGGLPSTNVYSMEEDLEGRIWVGTDQGVVVFYSPGSVFEQGVNFDAQRIFVEVDGVTNYLLETEVVTTIAIDGANRKWFGTQSSGVFLMSEDGSEEIFHFTKENSSLISNEIVDIGVNPFNGEVMIATGDGVVAYKGTATEGDPLYQDVYAYPNPVSPGFTGNIAIKGLAPNSAVKITDINGNLVFDTYADGGQAIWNGKNMNGSPVPAGVYLVFASDSEGLEAAATKILINR